MEGKSSAGVGKRGIGDEWGKLMPEQTEIAESIVTLWRQFTNRVEALSDNGGPFAGRVLFAVDLLLGFGQESLLLSLSAFGAIFVQKLHHLNRENESAS